MQIGSQVLLNVEKLVRNQNCAKFQVTVDPRSGREGEKCRRPIKVISFISHIKLIEGTTLGEYQLLSFLQSERGKAYYSLLFISFMLLLSTPLQV